jgi:membrane protease YdiL (CAAX protease family)
MSLFAAQGELERVLVLLSALALAGLAVWLVLAKRAYRRAPILPREPRRPVPWGLPDLLMVLVVFLGLQVAVLFAAEHLLGPEATRGPAMYDVDKAETEHPIGRLIDYGRSNPVVLIVCALAAVVVAPIAEEFLYRLLLQGWLERVWEQHRGQMPLLRRLLPGGVGPILLVAIVFARGHFRVPGAPQDPGFTVFVLIGGGAAALTTVVFAVVLLRVHVGATAADLGRNLQKLPGDVARGVLAFLLIAAPLYAAQMGLRSLLPKYIPPDPFTLFPFAVLLGFLYYRTHRLAPSIVLHMSLNGTTLLLVWLAPS